MCSSVYLAMLLSSLCYSGRTEMPINTVEYEEWNFGFNLKLSYSVSRCCENATSKIISIIGKLSSPFGLTVGNISVIVNKVVPEAKHKNKKLQSSSRVEVKIHEFDVDWKGKSEEGDDVSIVGKALVTIDEDSTAKLSLKKAKVTAVTDDGVVESSYEEIIGYAHPRSAYVTKTNEEVLILKTDQSQIASAASASTEDPHALLPNSSIGCWCRCGVTKGRVRATLDQWQLMPNGVQMNRPDIEQKSKNLKGQNGNSESFRKKNSRREFSKKKTSADNESKLLKKALPQA
jgi:hypothetical protein